MGTKATKSNNNLSCVRDRIDDLCSSEAKHDITTAPATELSVSTRRFQKQKLQIRKIRHGF
jgi:hypothetical protein